MNTQSFSRTSKLILFLAVASTCSRAFSPELEKSSLTDYPPAPKAEPFGETVYGIQVTDPYRWMELPARKDEMVRWIEASSAQTKAALAAMPGRADLLKELKNASQASAEHYNVQIAGDCLFFSSSRQTVVCPF